MRILLFSIAIIVVSCQNKDKRDSDNVLQNYLVNPHFKKVHDTLIYPFHGASYKVVFDRTTNGTISNIFGYLANNPNFYGSYFKFDIYGKLDKYYFMAGDGEHDLYRVTYNSDKAEYEEQGNAYVDYLAPNTVKDTGNDYTFVFSSFPRKHLEAFYSVDKIHFNKIRLAEQEKVPYIIAGEITLTKTQVDQGIIIKVQSKDLREQLKGLESNRETTDTVQFK